MDDLLEHLFAHHPPKDDEQTLRYEAIRDAGRAFAAALLKNTPECEDQRVALRKVREAVMTANAAIALEGWS